jgi:beta-galactosidase
MFRYTYKGTTDYLHIKVETTIINEDWQYLENNTLDFDQAMNSMQWEDIDLPHSWNKLDAVDLVSGYRRDASWYKKSIEIEIDPGALYKLYFEGVNITSAIYVNGNHAYTHKGGSVGFEVDITPYVSEQIPSTEISVRVENSFNPQIIPAQKSDYLKCGGITRDVWFKTIPKINIDKVLITAPMIAKD